MIATQHRGLVTVTYAVLRGMIARNRGHIINLGSTAGSYQYAGGNIYGATKAFVKQFSLNLRADLLGTNVRVSNVEPGLCGGTEFSNVRYHGDAAKAAASTKTSITSRRRTSPKPCCGLPNARHTSTSTASK